ncbi:hypothetical protein [Ramlibacter alkalitolerans]|uniref:Sulfatase-modifying factor enzyme domain-containing protein n=1 Tax=Ramlibacter alkalitolerans TaxID=2039631 RepID=A0ABS1JUC1_9BURK|nr:hypothetical protein [Ramlibacter alkalitolerans]MBL0427761.1 hypothetical protein [Ramlibacter alkalitolerans]
MYAALILLVAALMASFGLSMRTHVAAETQLEVRLSRDVSTGYSYMSSTAVVTTDTLSNVVDYVLANSKTDSAGVIIPPTAATGTDVWGRYLRACFANRSDVGDAAFGSFWWSTSYGQAVNLPNTVSSMTATVWQPVYLVQSSGASGVFSKTCSQALQTNASVLQADTANPVVLMLHPKANAPLPVLGANPYFRDSVRQKSVLDAMQGRTDGEVRLAVVEKTLYRWDAAASKWVALSKPAAALPSCPAGWVAVPETTLANGLFVPAFCVTSGEVQSGESAESASPIPLATGLATNGAPATPSVALFDEAKTMCTALSSARGQVISDSQWESILAQLRLDARNITAAGDMARGVSVTAARDLGYYDKGYAQPFGASNCSTRTSAVDTQRDLCLGDQVIWDFAGNLSEWVYTGPNGLSDLVTLNYSTKTATLTGKAVVPPASPGYCDLSAATCTASGGSYSLANLFNKKGLWAVYTKTGVYAVQYGTGAYYTVASTQVMRGGGGLLQDDKAAVADTRPYGPGSYELAAGGSARAGVRCTMPPLQ